MNQSPPQSPTITSPCSPTSAHPFDLHTTSSVSPLTTTMPLHSALRRSSVIHNASPSRQSRRNPLGLSVETRRSSIASFPSPMDTVMNPPLSAPPTRMTYVVPSPTKHSRMDVRSPILEQIVSLPLRLSTNARRPSALADTTLQAEADFSSSVVPIERRKSRQSPSHSRTPAISATQRAGTRSPIRKRNQSPARSRSRSRSRSHSTRTPPPTYRLTALSPAQRVITSTKPTYLSILSHLGAPLVPLVSVSSGLPHPEFPRSLLQYHLLTHDQLDSLARWYHQVEPATEETWCYPAWIPAWTPRDAARAGQEETDEIALETKRRRWGRFMGLRGCESPTLPAANGVGKEEVEEQEAEELEEGLVERMEREWRNSLRRAEDEKALREKGWRWRW